MIEIGTFIVLISHDLLVIISKLEMFLYTLKVVNRRVGMTCCNYPDTNNCSPFDNCKLSALLSFSP